MIDEEQRKSLHAGSLTSDLCPDCGTQLEKSCGCAMCRMCGYSPCG